MSKAQALIDDITRVTTPSEMLEGHSGYSVHKISADVHHVKHGEGVIGTVTKMAGGMHKAHYKGGRKSSAGKSASVQNHRMAVNFIKKHHGVD